MKSNYVTWVDIQGFGNEAELRGVAEAFDLHPIALENAVNVPQRAKAESYADHNLIIARSPVMGEDRAISVPQVCFIVGDGFLITFQERYLGFFDAAPGSSDAHSYDPQTIGCSEARGAPSARGH